MDAGTITPSVHDQAFRWGGLSSARSSAGPLLLQTRLRGILLASVGPSPTDKLAPHPRCQISILELIVDGIVTSADVSGQAISRGEERGKPWPPPGANGASSASGPATAGGEGRQRVQLLPMDAVSLKRGRCRGVSITSCEHALPVAGGRRRPK